MGTRNAQWMIAAAALIGGAAPSLAQQQQPAPQGPSRILDQQGVKRKTSSANQRYALPSIKIESVGVKAQAPRGIGKVHGTLLPPPGDPNVPPPSAPVVQDRAGPRSSSDDPWNGVLSTDSYGRVHARPIEPWETPHPTVDPETLASGDNVKIARMLRPAIDYSFLSRYDQWLLAGFAGGCHCKMGLYFHDGPIGDSTFSADNYAPTDPHAPMIDPQSADTFVRNGNSPTTPQAAADPEAGLTDFEKAGNRLYDGKPDQAVVLLRAYTAAHPDDVEGIRALALALLDAKRTKEGVELMGQIYDRAPTLAASPIPPDAVGPERELRDLVVRVVAYAHQNNTPAAWLTAAMLMQGEGRNEPALKMIDKADGASLAADVSSAMRAALAR